MLSGYASYNLNLVTVNNILPLSWPDALTNNPMALSNSFQASNNGYMVVLPDASQVALGVGFLVTNQSSSSAGFTLSDNTGSPILFVSPGQIYFIQLTGYTSVTINNISTVTNQGNWTSILIGANSSLSDLEQFAGYGLSSNNGELSTIYSTVTNIPVADSSSYSVSLLDQSSLLINSVSGLTTLVLPNNLPAGFFFALNNLGDSTGCSPMSVISLPTVGTNVPLINNQVGLEIAPYQSLTMVFDGTNYWTIGLALNQLSIAPVSVIDLSTAGANIVLTQTQLSAQVIVLYSTSGTIGGDIVVYFPTTAGAQWTIVNSLPSDNSYNLTIQAGSVTAPTGTTYIIPNTAAATVFYNTQTLSLQTANYFANNLIFQSPGTITDTTGSVGTDGSVLTNTSTGIVWGGAAVPTATADNSILYWSSGQWMVLVPPASNSTLGFSTTSGIFWSSLALLNDSISEEITSLSQIEEVESVDLNMSAGEEI